MNFDIQDINFLNIFIILAIIGAAVIVARIASFLLTKFFETSSRFLGVKAARYTFFKNVITLLIYLGALLFIIYSIPQLRTLALTLFAGAGIFAAIVGLASQQAFSNIINGMFLVAFRPFRVGDIIKIGENHMGTVEDITLRHTIIKDLENKHIIIPNSLIGNETIINYNIQEEEICKFVEIGISYSSNIDKAIAIIQEAALKHPSSIDHRTKEEKERDEHPVKVKVIGFGDSSVNLRAYVWAKDPIAAREMSFDLNKSIKEQFDEGGIEIPFPYRTIVYKRDIDETEPKQDTQKDGDVSGGHK